MWIAGVRQNGCHASYCSTTVRCLSTGRALCRAPRVSDFMERVRRETYGSGKSEEDSERSIRCGGGIPSPRHHNPRRFGADSLDVVDLLMSIEDEFELEIPDEETDKIKTVGELVQYIEDHT